MKIEEAIGRIRDHMERHGIGEYPHVKLEEAFETVISIIDRLKSTEPLTVEQLKAMENAEPVWWKSASMWCLAQNGNIITPSGQCYDAKLFPRDFYSFPIAYMDSNEWKPCGEMCGKACWNCDHDADSVWGDGEFCKDCIQYSKWESVVNQYCQRCGRPRTPEAWKMLENRLGR